MLMNILRYISVPMMMFLQQNSSVDSSAELHAGHLDLRFFNINSLREKNHL